MKKPLKNRAKDTFYQHDSANRVKPKFTTEMEQMQMFLRFEKTPQLFLTKTAAAATMTTKWGIHPQYCAPLWKKKKSVLLTTMMVMTSLLCFTVKHF